MMIKLITKNYQQEALKGFLIYGIGDFLAAWILGEVSFSRTLGMAVLGGTVYALEIPNYFRWIENKTNRYSLIHKALSKPLLALIYFNPLWVARHSFFIFLVSGQWERINWEIIDKSVDTFIIAVPVTLLANTIIQILIPLKHRFLSSALFSCAMAIYYALMA